MNYRHRLLILALVAGIGLSVYVLFSSGVISSASTTKNKDSLVIQAESVSFPADLSSLFNKVDNTAQNDIVSGGYVFIHQNVIDTARNCEFCTVIEYSPNASNKAFDVAWNSAQKYNISNAKKLTFFAMGGNGDESVSFKSLGKTKFDINSKPTNERTFGLTTTPTTLEKTWKKFEIDLSGKDLRGTDSPFAVSILKPNTNEVSAVYVKDLELDNTPVQPENDNAVRLDEATQLR